MKTQSIKLNKVLHNGMLRQVKMNELLNEIDNFEGVSLFNKKEECQRIQSEIMKGYTCWEFTPYEGIDCEKLRQFSPNPFTLINFVYAELK